MIFSTIFCEISLTLTCLSFPSPSRSHTTQTGLSLPLGFLRSVTKDWLQETIPGLAGSFLFHSEISCSFLCFFFCLILTPFVLHWLCRYLIAENERLKLSATYKLNNLYLYKHQCKRKTTEVHIAPEFLPSQHNPPVCVHIHPQLKLCWWDRTTKRWCPHQYS